MGNHAPDGRPENPSVQAHPHTRPRRLAQPWRRAYDAGSPAATPPHPWRTDE
jgi:hypothetical protein